MQAPVEICYAGVVIARAEEVREGEGGEFFIVMKDPLPVGTLLGVRSADSLVSARVLRVVESADAAGSGMQVRPAGSDDAGAAIWIPPPPAAKPGSTQAAAATQATAAVATPAADDPAPAQAAPVEAAAASASESPAAAPTEEPAPDDRSPTRLSSARFQPPRFLSQSHRRSGLWTRCPSGKRNSPLQQKPFRPSLLRLRTRLTAPLFPKRFPWRLAPV